MEAVVEKKAKVKAFDKRIHEIDFARGFLMCLVIMDHIFNLLMIFNNSWATRVPDVAMFKVIGDFFSWYWTWPVRIIVRYIALSGFCFVSGISSAFSRSNWKRAFEMLAFWFVLFIMSNIGESLKTSLNLNVGIPLIRVDFNIIGVLAFSTLAYCFFQERDWKTLLFIGIGFVLFHIPLEFASQTANGQAKYTMFLWQSQELVPQADFMPLFPYIGMFFLGAAVSAITYAKHKSSYIKKHEFERPICFLGRHSLIIYLTHYFVLLGLFKIVDLFIK